MIDKFANKELLAFIIIMMSFQTAIIILIFNNLKKNYNDVMNKLDQLSKDHTTIYKTIKKELE